jgi:hypothetical protein
VVEIDFITALARLLRDGRLRDAFAVSPQSVAKQMNLRANDWPWLLQLQADDLEFQARVLLRKRFDLVHNLLPETMRRMDEKGWPAFFEFARLNWPEDRSTVLQDAFQVCRRLRRENFASVSHAEWNRLNFALSKRHLSIRGSRRESKVGRSRPMLQVFVRCFSSKSYELDLFLEL